MTTEFLRKVGRAIDDYTLAWINHLAYLVLGDPPSPAKRRAYQERRAHKINFDHFSETRHGMTPYDEIAFVIEHLYKYTPKIKTKKRFAEEKFRPQNPYHGFTTYEVDWANAVLPQSVTEFLHAQGPHERVNVLVDDYTLYFPQDASDETWVHRLSLETKSGSVDLAVKKRILDKQDYESHNPYSAWDILDFKYLPDNNEGEITTQEDPRNFHIEDAPIPDEQFSLIKKTLEFALKERKRQMS